MSEKKSVVKNYIYNVIYSLLSVVMPLITIPYASRVLQPEGIGQVSYAQNIASYFVLFASLGIPNYGIREIAKAGIDMEDRSKTFREIFRINAIATSISTIAYILCIILIPFFYERKELLLICGISLVLNFFNIDWFYRGIEQFGYITIRSYCIKIISVIAIFVFVNQKEDVYIYALILTLSTTLNFVLNAFQLRNYLQWNRRTKIEMKKHIRPIFFLFASAIAIELYAQLDTTMVGAICGDKFVGYYTNPRRIVLVITTIINSLGVVLLPKLSVYYVKNNYDSLNQVITKCVDYIITLSIPSFLGVFFTANDIVHIMFGSSFQPSVLTLKLLSILIPILAIGNIFGTQLLIAFNLESRLTLSVFAGALINLILNAVLILNFKQNGAALASVIAEFTVMCLQVFFCRKQLHLKFNYRDSIKVGIQSLGMIVTLVFVRSLIDFVVIRLIVEILMAVFVYLILGIVIKNETIILSLKRISRDK